MHVRKNDTVVVVSGNSKGKEGKVLKIFTETNKVIIEGVNIVKRHTKPSAKNQQGGVVMKEAPINASNVMIKDPKSGEPTRVGKQRLKDGSSGKTKIVRIAKKAARHYN